jgi:hypothetical protein
MPLTNIHRSLALNKTSGKSQRGHLNLSVSKLDRRTILIEGNRRALESLGRILLERTREKDCGYQMSPDGAGSDHFSKDSKFGLYIHRLPCTNGRKKK